MTFDENNDRNMKPASDFDLSRFGNRLNQLLFPI
jgi:hypothetical protein